MKALVLIVAGALAIAAGWWAEDGLPGPARLVESVSTEPLQSTPMSPTPFGARAGGVDYRMQPMADYDISGLVVSEHDSDAWWDWIHAASNDHINVVDLCVVWGANAASGAYTKMSFSSGQFVCYYSTRHAEAATRENTRALSNNHLLTDEAAIARKLRGVRIGDQIRIRGQLVEYSHNHGFNFVRGTSLTRDDTGNGACETIFVRSVEVLRSAPAWPRWLKWLGVALMLSGAVLWFAQPHRPLDD